jgi:hypothetical protein
MFHTVFGGDLMDCKEGIRYRQFLLEKGGKPGRDGNFN